MIRLLGALALLLALHPASHALPRAERTLAVASAAHSQPITLDPVNSLATLLSSRFTPIAPDATAIDQPTPTPFSRVSRRWLLSAHLLL